jgi:hypothetical protein
MARKTPREPKIDAELAFAYAKIDRLHDMEDFLSMLLISLTRARNVSTTGLPSSRAAVHQRFELGSIGHNTRLPPGRRRERSQGWKHRVSDR